MATFHKIAILIGGLIIFNEIASTLTDWPSISDFFPVECASPVSGDAGSADCEGLATSGSKLMNSIPMMVGLVFLFVGSIGLVNSSHRSTR